MVHPTIIERYCTQAPDFLYLVCSLQALSGINMKKLIAAICLFVALQASTAAAPLQLLSPPAGPLDASTKTAVEQLLGKKWGPRIQQQT